MTTKKKPAAFCGCAEPRFVTDCRVGNQETVRCNRCGRTKTVTIKAKREPANLADISTR